MIADRARQLEQLERPFEIEFDILGDRGARRLLALAELDVRPEPARLALDRQPGVGIVAEHSGPVDSSPSPPGWAKRRVYLHSG
jgi:hypothetical protein